MLISIYFFLFTKYLSYVVPLIVIWRKKIRGKIISYLSLFLSFSLVFSLTSRMFALANGSAIPVYHIAIFIRYIFFLLIFNDLRKNPRLFWICSILACCIFFFESIYLNGWWDNNELMTNFSNVSLTAIAIPYLYIISNQKDSEISIFKFYLIGSILVYNGSFIVLSLFETEIAQDQSFADFFLIIYYNIVETFLNLGIAYSIWKLKEA
jgi:hypothetical protein